LLAISKIRDLREGEGGKTTSQLGPYVNFGTSNQDEESPVARRIQDHNRHAGIAQTEAHESGTGFSAVFRTIPGCGCHHNGSVQSRRVSINKPRGTPLPPPAKDPRRRIIEQNIVVRINDYLSDPSRFEARVLDSIAKGFSPAVVNAIPASLCSGS
jgi:hypothetical protein